MGNFYKITKEEAEVIGMFIYSPGKAFDPFVSEQIDGTFIVEEKMYNLLKNHEKFSSVYWGDKMTIEEKDLDTKEVPVKIQPK